MEDPVASIRFIDAVCARAAMVGEDVGVVAVVGAGRRGEADGDDGGGFPSLAAHPVEIGLRVCWWGGVAHGEPRTMSRRPPPLYIAQYDGGLPIM